MDTTQHVKLLEFNVLGDEKGLLVAVEQEKQIPFDIKRLFYIYDTDTGVVRGQHANKYSEFCLVAVVGSCKVKILYPHGIEENFELTSPNKALYIPKMIWKEMYDFSSDCVLLVMSNEFYNPTEYIDSLDDYLVGDDNG